MMHVVQYLFFPVGLEHLDNTIETDHLSLVLQDCVGGTKIGCWLFYCVGALHFLLMRQKSGDVLPF